MWESFEQSVTDPENQPSQYGTVLMKEWQGLTEWEIIGMKSAIKGTLDVQFNDFARAIEAKLKEKNNES
jgi:hypothetical protein